MKRWLFLALVCPVVFARAQDPHRRRDTIPVGQWKSEVVKAPVLTGTGGSQPIIIVPNNMQFCFDKELYLKMSVSGRMSEQVIYLDTHKGLTGILPPSRQGGAIEEIMPELEHFNFTVMSMKGNIFVYKTQKGKGDQLERWVSTGNTTSFLYQSPTRANPGQMTSALARKSESRSYCDGRITAQAYKYDGGTTTWYLYGDRFPAQLHPVKYMGAYGVGYMLTQEGMYLVMELNFGNTYVRIGDMQLVHNCFNPSDFKSVEDNFVVKRNEDIQREEQKTADEEAHISGDCASEKQAVVDFKKELNRKHEDLVRRSQHGNVYQDTVAQRAMLRMNDPLDAVKQGILSARVGICGAEHDMAKYPSHMSEDQAKIRCLQHQIRQLQDVEARMEAFDRQYASQPARANVEKGKAYWDFMKTGPRCD